MCCSFMTPNMCPMVGHPVGRGWEVFLALTSCMCKSHSLSLPLTPTFCINMPSSVCLRQRKVTCCCAHRKLGRVISPLLTIISSLCSSLVHGGCIVPLAYIPLPCPALLSSALCSLSDINLLSIGLLRLVH